MSATVDFAIELMRRTSVSPDDAGCQQLIAERLEPAGFTIEALPFGDVSNLWARRGRQGPVLCFAGHTDVVPAGPRELWDSDPFDPEIRNGIVYGRGAADMKCSLAAMIDAAVDFSGQHADHKGSIAFLITSDEEGRARDGTLKVMETLDGRNESIDWCVIGEPSCSSRLGDTIRIGRRGSLSGMLTVHGRQGHVAYPELASNPIQSLAPVLAELYAKPIDAGNEYYPPSSFQMVKIASDAGAPNVTPGSLSARFNFRYSTVWSHQTLKAFVENLFDKHGLDYSLDWHLSGEPFLTPAGQLTDVVQQAVRRATGVQPELSTGGGTSDGRFISPSGVQVVEFGPVNTSIHKANEQIPVADIDVMKTAYREILDQLLT